MKLKLLFFLFPLITFSQIQVGDDILGNIEDQLGWAVSQSADGTILAIGACYSSPNGLNNSGMVKMYEYNGTDWQQKGQDLYGENAQDLFGYGLSLAADGNLLAIGAINANGTKGRVKIYFFNENQWQQLGDDILGDSSGDSLGNDISFSSDANTVAISARGNAQNTGQVKIYQLNENQWIQLGQSINGETQGDNFGVSVSLSANGEIIAVGGNHNDDAGFNAGHAKVFQLNNNQWQQLGQNINGASTDDNFGVSVSISANGNRVAIGARYNDENGMDSGEVKIFDFNGSQWEQKGQDINGEAAYDYAGSIVSLSGYGNVIAIGAPHNDSNGNFDAGQVRVYQLFGNTWQQIGEDINGETGHNYFGRSVSLSENGTMVASGAPNYQNGDDAGQVRVFDMSESLGITHSILNHVSIYPNPAKESINIELHNDIILLHANIYSISGQLLHTTTTSLVDISNLTSGIYFVEVHSEQGAAVKAFIKQ